MTLDAVLYVVSWACLAGGGVFAVIGAVGLLRMPDTFTRLHAASVIETLGAGLILLGLILQAGWSLITVKLVLLAFLLFFLSPLSSHAIARAAMHFGVKPMTMDDDPAQGETRS